MQYLQQVSWETASEMQSPGPRSLWLAVRDLFFYPGDVALRFLVENSPGIASWLEHSRPGVPGVVEGILSIVIWLAAINIVLGVARFIRSLF